MDLAKKRADLIAEHAAMVKHDPAWKGTDLHERPVAFLCDDELVVLGECAGKIINALREFLSKAGDYEDRAKREPMVARALVKCRKLAEADEAEELRIPQADWNTVNFGLGEVGCHCCLADGTY